MTFKQLLTELELLLVRGLFFLEDRLDRFLDRWDSWDLWNRWSSWESPLSIAAYSPALAGGAAGLFLALALVLGCATHTVIPGVQVGAAANPNGTVGAEVELDPAALACFLLELVGAEDYCPLSEGMADEVDLPVGATTSADDLVALRGSSLSQRSPAIPNIAPLEAPACRYEPWRGECLTETERTALLPRSNRIPGLPRMLETV